MKTQTIVRPIEILLVESSSGDPLYYEESVKKDSTSTFNFSHAENLIDAIEYIEDNDYDIILLEPDLPDSEGFETFISVRMYAPKVPIILLLNVSEEDLAVKSLQNGAQDCIVRTQIDNGILRRAIRFAIERHRIMADLEQTREKERRLAYFDVLTNLPNRQLFYDRLDRALSHANRYEEKIALMFIDLDRFKPVNDTMGHNTGDMLLKTVAKRLKDCLRKSDTVARIGGDEFTCILPHIESKKDVTVVARKIKKALATPFDLNGFNVAISGSIGISIFPEDTLDMHNLIKKADMAMYHAKQLGRDNFQFFSSHIELLNPKHMPGKNKLQPVPDSGKVLLREGVNRLFR